MYAQILQIAQLMAGAFLQLWPYLLVTIPLAVMVQLSGASKWIRRAFEAQPIVAIFLATAVGAFSPFCSCGVIPLVASLLIGGVPLAPVMSFWIASPSMDPEAFFLSVGMLGWELAVWRMAATLLISLGAGLITHFLIINGWLGENILRTYQPPRVRDWGELLRTTWAQIWRRSGLVWRNLAPPAFRKADPVCCAATSASLPATVQLLQVALPEPATANATGECGSSCGSTLPQTGIPIRQAQPSGIPEAAPIVLPWRSPDFARRLWQETISAGGMVLKFMALTFFLEALIELYVPQTWIAGLLGQQNPFAIISAALFGIPVYTSNLTALPLIGGLLHQGMHPAAALAFLIAGPTTTLPAMAAVWGLVSRRVFALYIGFALMGAVLFGYLFLLLGS